jgi:hypothetical protein
MAPALVGFMGMCAFAMVARSVLIHDPWFYWEFLSLLLVGVLSSRLKVKLPGVNGNMSVNLPFIFISMTQLGLAGALLVAGVSIFTQSLPKRPNRFKPVQVFFNVCTGLVAAGLGWELFHYAALHMNSALAIVVACAVHLLASTMAVAAIISATERQNAWRTWSEILHLSFPYYVASTGIASIAASFGGSTSWPMLVGISFVMFVTYRSYRLYFGVVGSSARTLGAARALQAKSAAASR